RADGVGLVERRGAANERLEVARRLDEALALEGDVAHHEEVVGARGIALYRQPRVLLGVVVGEELVAKDARHLAVKAAPDDVALGEREFALDELHDARGIASSRIGVAESSRDRRGSRGGGPHAPTARSGRWPWAPSLRAPRSQ